MTPEEVTAMLAEIDHLIPPESTGQFAMIDAVRNLAFCVIRLRALVQNLYDEHYAREL